MGQAKQRGSYEERRARAIDQRAKEIALQQELMRRRPSPKHTRTMAKLERDAAKNESVWMDAKRLAMELECLMHDCDLAAVSKWWDSAHEALELHRQLIQETYAAMEATNGQGN